MKFVYFTLLSCFSVYGQWITGFLGAQNGVLPASRIPWSKYTHIIHFAAAPNSDGSVDLHYLVPDEIAQVVASRPSGKKIMFCLKDNDGDLNAFPNATSPALMGAFVQNLVNFTNQYGYDGLDIDWEANINVAQYSDLIARLRSAMPGKVITMDGGNWDGLWTVAANNASALDQVNIMCYDLDGADNGYSWYDDALFQNGNSQLLTCDWRMHPFLAAGVPPSKIGIGIPFYGRRWSGVVAALVPGLFTQSTIFYRDLAVDTTRFQSQFQFYDNTYKSNYLSIPDMGEFDSYVGPEHIHDTVAWQRSAGLGGFMTFTLDYEFIASRTGDAASPLSTALANEVFGGNAGPAPGPTSTPGPTTTPPPAPKPAGVGPVVLSVTPSGNLPAAVTSVDITATTNVPATCRYGVGHTADFNYLSFGFTDQGTSHTTTIYVSGGTNTVYIKCQDANGVTNTTDYVTVLNVPAS